MSDLISRQAAIEAAMEELESGTYFDIPSKIKGLPSVQPEILACGEGELNVPDTNVGDTISRQVAIDAIQRIGRLATLPDNDAVIRMSAVEYVLYNLPSEQPMQTNTHNALTALDCISRQAAIEEWKNDFKGYVNALNIPRDDYNGICAESVDRKLVYKEMEYIDELPSAQSEIIRCKDCLNWIPGYITDQDDFIPPKCGKYQQMVGHSSDDYCSYAERRTDDADVNT